MLDALKKIFVLVFCLGRSGGGSEESGWSPGVEGVDRPALDEWDLLVVMHAEVIASYAP